MPAVRGLDLLAPHVLGHVSLGEPARYWGRALYGEPIFPYLPSLYPGLLLTLVGLFACCWRRRVLWPWAAVAAVGFLVALGSHFPLWHLVRRLPLLSGVRFPEKFALLVAFPLLVAAAYGFDLVTLGPEKARRLLVRVAGVLLAAGLLLTGLLVIWPARLGPGFPAREAAGDALRLAIVAFVTMGALWIGRRLGRRNGALVLCAVGALDLATAGRDLVPQTPLANLTTPPAFLRPLVAQARDDVIVHLAAWKKNPRVHSRLAKPPIPAQWGLAMTLESDFDLTQLRWTTRSTAAFLEATEGNPALAEALLERRGVSAVVQIREGLTGPGGAAPDATGPADLQTIAAEHVRPIAFAVARVAIVHGEAGWRDAVRRLGRDAANAACVEDTELAAFPERPSPARVRVATRTPMRVVLVVDAQGPEPSFVAVNQTWDDGWRALIDGKPTRLLRTDLSLSGLVVPPGRHQIELTYQNDLVDLGVGISVTALVACLVLVLLGRRGRARRT
jgi:hypothetical protein